MVETISSQYTTREMIEALNIVPPTNTFLLDMLVKRERTHTTRYIEIDVTHKGQTKAAYVSVTGPAEVLAKNGFDSKIHLLPYTKQKMTLTWEDLETRLAGNTVYDSGTPQQRRDALLGEWLGDLRQRVVRLEEYQLAQAITNGTAVISGNGVSYTITYGRAAGNAATLTAGARWSQATRDIPQDFRNAATQMQSAGVDGGSPDVCILGYGAAANFMAEATTTDTELKNMLDMIKLDRGMINVQFLREQNATYIGTVRDIGIDCDVYAYNGKYVDSGGSEAYYIGQHDAIFVNTACRVEKHYSPIVNLKSSFVGRWFPDSYVAQDGSAEFLTLESGPLVALHDPNTTYHLATNG